MTAICWPAVCNGNRSATVKKCAAPKRAIAKIQGSNQKIAVKLMEIISDFVLPFSCSLISTELLTFTINLPLQPTTLDFMVTSFSPYLSRGCILFSAGMFWIRWIIYMSQTSATCSTSSTKHHIALTSPHNITSLYLIPSVTHCSTSIFIRKNSIISQWAIDHPIHRIRWHWTSNYINYKIVTAEMMQWNLLYQDE